MSLLAQKNSGSAQTLGKVQFGTNLLRFVLAKPVPAGLVAGALLTHVTGLVLQLPRSEIGDYLGSVQIEVRSSLVDVNQS